MQEMLFVPFYIFYFFEWFVKLFRYGTQAYRNVSFERKAYENEMDTNYLQKRKLYRWIRYL